MNRLYLLLLLILFAITGCKKEPEINSVALLPPAQQPPILNTPPNVSAGPKIQLVLPDDSCILTGVATASGFRIKTYLWEKTSGPAAYKIEHPDSLITKVHLLQEGTYTFTLTVTDSSGLQGKASVAVSVESIAAFEYNLDLNIHAGYNFFNDLRVCGEFDCDYIDQTIISTSVQLSPSDNLLVDIYENTDSAAQAYNGYGHTAFRLSDKLYASGNSSFNLKKIMQQGGGSFYDTIHLIGSSALRTGREAAFKALPPLTVTGKLNIAIRTVDIQIKGKIIF